MKYEIAADEMKAYYEAHQGHERSTEEALGNLKVYMSGSEMTFETVQAAADRARRFKSMMAEIVSAWGRKHYFDPKRVYAIDWRKNEVSVNRA